MGSGAFIAMRAFGEGADVKARKAYCCAWCTTFIEKGERHYHYVGKWEGEFQDWRMHTDCEIAFRREDKATDGDGGICQEGHARGKTCGE